MSDISAQDKVSIVESHKKNIIFNQYNNQLSALEEKAKTNPNQENISSLDAQAADYVKQLAVLNSELATLNAEIAAQSQQ